MANQTTNIVDYLKWRGDIPLTVDGFNEVDNLILAELAYSDFDGIVPPTKEQVSLSEVYEKFFTMYTEEEILAKKTFVKMAPFLMDYMVESVRFGDMKLAFFVNEIESDSQLSATTYFLPDNSIYIAYRGTDNTIAGWKEDFNFFRVSETPGQRKAVEYLNYVMEQLEEGVHVKVGGHSKGGNFAMYAAAFCKEEYRDRIDIVYSNDGPGFLECIIGTPEYQNMRKKVVSIIPEASLVGVLLFNHVNHKMVKSVGRVSPEHHDALAWVVEGKEFVVADSRTSNSIIFDKTLRNWMASLDSSEKELFINSFFAIFESVGVETFGELSGNTKEMLGFITKAAMHMSKEKQKSLRSIVGRLISTGSQIITEDVKEGTLSLFNSIQSKIPKRKKNLLEKKESEEN